MLQGGNSILLRKRIRHNWKASPPPLSRREGRVKKASPTGGGLEGAYTVGDTEHGKRIVIPITGGTFEGPRLKGTILPGGADYQMATADGSRTELEAIYSIKTDDGIYIHVRNRGLVCDGKDPQGQPYYYFKAGPKRLLGHEVASLSGNKVTSPQDLITLKPHNFVCQPEWVKDFMAASYLMCGR